jgi:hypothetical protein
MKTDILKKLIKDAVKEAIQDELKDILLEAIRAPKTQTITESFKPSLQPQSQPIQSNVDMRQKYQDILGETALSFTSRDVTPFNPGATADPVNGNLGTGEVGMDQIMGLLNTK